MSLPIDRNYFKEYKNECDVWIESGTFMGGGVTSAVLAGFTEIHTVDLKNNLDPNYKHGLKNINFYYGDSAETFDKIIFPKIGNKRPMLWLDGHSMLTENETESYPLLRELDAIRSHGITNATILIDDYLYMSHPLITGWTHKQIEAALKRINPAYRIEYLPNPIINNILLARV